MSNKKQRTQILPFDRLYPLTTFSMGGKMYRKIGNLTALNEQDGTSVFYPNERVRVEQQPPQTMLLWEVGDEATIICPTVNFQPQETRAGDAKTELSLDTPVNIIQFNNKG